MKRFLSISLVITLLIALVGCSGEKEAAKKIVNDTTAEKNLPVLGDNVKFDPNILINNGEPIEIDFWVWDSKEIFQSIVDDFEKIYPNISIKVVSQPWGDYWTKLPLSIQGGDGPALFCVHNSQHDNLINNMEAYDIDIEDLKADFTGVEGHVIDGKVYYIDYGMMTGSIFYNKDMWADAGLTDSDIPETWDEFTKVAQKLTKKDDNGNITQAGFNYNSDVKSIIMGLNYQKGQMLFKEDGITPDINNKIMNENIQFLIDLYDEYGVGSKDFGISDAESFGQGQSAMVYKWGWYYNQLLNDYPDVNFGVFRTPVPDENTPFAYDRYNGESTIGISAKADDASKEVAQAFIRYFMSNDDALKELCIKYSIFPSKKTLADDEDVQNHPVLGTIKPVVDRLIWPGPFPGIIETTLQQSFEDVIYNGNDVETTFSDGNKKVITDMEGISFTSVEEKYKYIDNK